MQASGVPARIGEQLPHEALSSAMRHLVRAQREVGAYVARHRDCAGSALAVLAVVAAEQDPSLGHVAETLRVDLSVASRQVADLVDRGLLTRDVAAGDRRVRVLRLTDAGDDVLRASRARLEAVGAALLASWSPDELADAAAMLERLAAALDVRRLPPSF